MPDLFFRKGVGGMLPKDVEAEEAYKRFALHEIIRVKGLTKPRNPKFHAKMWAFFKILSDHSPENYTPEQIKELLKIRTGHVEWVTCPGVDHPVPLPKSMDFASMDQIQAEAFFSRCVDAALIHFMPQGVSRKEMDDAVMEIAGF